MQPTLTTPRLTLRPFTPADAAEVERMAGDVRVARPTAAIPHPYPAGGAVGWIATHAAAWSAGERAVYAIADRASGSLRGAIDLFDMAPEHARGEIGFWVGQAHWGQGIGPEAITAMVTHAQTHWGLSRVRARCLASNQASARALEKAGMQPEGRLVQHILHWGAYEDVLLYGINLPGRVAPV